MNELQLKQDLHYCETIIKKNSKSFYYAFSNLPEHKRNAVYVIYAFCRVADDSIDEINTYFDKKKALEELKHHLDLFKMNQEIDHPLWRALRHVFDNYEMNITYFYDQLKGQELDLHFKTPKNILILEEYCYFVAGSVGLMLLPIIGGNRMKDLTRVAIKLGIAMQITNILRDIGEDYHVRKRIYLPEDIQALYGYSSEKIENQVIDDTFINLWEHLAVRAEGFYDAFLLDINKLDQDSVDAVKLALTLYRELLNVIRNNNYDSISQRNYVEVEKFH